MDAHKIEHALNSYPPTSNETAVEYVARMNTPSVTITDATPYTWSGLAIRLMELTENPLLVVAFEQALASAPGGSLLDKCLASGGVDFSQDAIQAGLDAVATDERSTAVVNAVKSVGKRQETPWQVMFGRDEVCSYYDASEVISAKVMQDLKDAARARWHSVWDRIVSGDITDIQTAVEAFGE